MIYFKENSNISFWMQLLYQQPFLLYDPTFLFITNLGLVQQEK